jgi:hypothetical protein
VPLGRDKGASEEAPNAPNHKAFARDFGAKLGLRQKPETGNRKPEKRISRGQCDLASGF